MGNEEIAYQNKDITSKVLAENFKGKTFRVYGLDLPEIRDVKPTNIPVVKANELRLDNLFELEDETVAVVDYESAYDQADKVKYLNYLTGIAGRYQKEKKACPVLRMIVIYTGDIRRDQVSEEYDIGAVKMNIEPAFLSELDSDRMMERLQENDRETANKIRRAIEMTQVAMIFEEEKQQAVQQAVEQAVKQTIEAERKKAADLKQQAVEAERKKAADLKQQAVEAERKRAMDAQQQTIVKMIEKGYPTEEIMFLVSGCSQNEVDALRKNMQGSLNGGNS